MLGRAGWQELFKRSRFHFGLPTLGIIDWTFLWLTEGHQLLQQPAVNPLSWNLPTSRCRVATLYVSSPVVYGDFHKWWYPNMDGEVYDGKKHRWHGCFGGLISGKPHFPFPHRIPQDGLNQHVATLSSIFESYPLEIKHGNWTSANKCFFC